MPSALTESQTQEVTEPRAKSRATAPAPRAGRGSHFYGAARATPVLSALVAFSAASAGARCDDAVYEALLKEKALPLVTIKFVLRASMGEMFGGDQESEDEITGVVIDSKGLILCSNTRLGGFVALMKHVMGGMASEISATPTDLKIIFGDETEEHEAELLARDSELDLAWVRIKDPGDRTFEYVDCEKGAIPKVGQEIVTVRRMDKYFGRTAAAVTARIGGITRKPRDLYIPTAGAAMTMGLPVYVLDGSLVGVSVLQSQEDEGAAENPMAILRRMSNMQDAFSGLILPAADVVRATKRAMQSIEPESAD